MVAFIAITSLVVTGCAIWVWARIGGPGPSAGPLGLWGRDAGRSLALAPRKWRRSGLGDW